MKKRQSSDSAVICTSFGDIHLKLFFKECPKTVENFCTHAKNGKILRKSYGVGVLFGFHRMGVLFYHFKFSHSYTMSFFIDISTTAKSYLIAGGGVRGFGTRPSGGEGD